MRSLSGFAAVTTSGEVRGLICRKQRKKFFFVSETRLRHDEKKNQKTFPGAARRYASGAD
jgi:hypothetical protein